MRTLSRQLPLPLVMALLVLLLAACASPRPALQDPSFRLAGVQPLSLGLLEQRFRLTLRVDNPNAVALPVRSLRYQVQLAGIEFAHGLTANGFSLPANDSTTFEVEVSTNLMSSLPQVLRLIDGRSGAVDYALTGEVEYGRFFRGKKPFEQKGQIRLTP